MNPEEIQNITSILFGNVPKTPPPKQEDIFEPSFIENNYKMSHHLNYDADIETIASLNLCGLDMFNTTEPPFPTFDFL